MRLIDADALTEEVWHSGLGSRQDCVDLIKTIPTVKRPHGEWEHWGSPFADDCIANSIVCSLCKARFLEIKGEDFNFCPNCGADMKEGEAE